MYLILVRKVRMSYTVRWEAHLKDNRDFLWTEEDILREKERLEKVGEVIKIFRVETGGN